MVALEQLTETMQMEHAEPLKLVKQHKLIVMREMERSITKKFEKQFNEKFMLHKDNLDLIKVRKHFAVAYGE